jgi:lysyl-tRNA synthetase class 2
VPAWASRLIWVLGLAAILGGAQGGHRRVLDWPNDLLPPLGRATVSVVGIAVGFGLLLMARGLRRRKRRAWRLTVVLLVTGIVVHVVRGTDPVQTLISTAVVLVLVASRREFIGRGDPRGRWAVPVVLMAMTGTCWLVGALLTQADRDELVAGWTVPQLLTHSALGLIGLTGPVRFTTAEAAGRTAGQLLGLSVVTIVVVLATVLRSSAVSPPATAEDRRAVRSLITTNSGTDSLGYFALRDDRSYVFSSSGKAAVSYRVVSGVCLAAADPLGDVEAWPQAIAAWLELVREQAWIPAVLATTETGAEVYRRVGFDAFELGDEAILEVDDFTLGGRAMRSVRQAVARARRTGHHSVIAQANSLTEEARDDLDRQSRAWCGGAAERGFSMTLSRPARDDDPGAVLVAARNAEGRLVALLQLMPWGRYGLSLDVMRRSPELAGGVVEMMIADLVTYAQQRGLARISLNFALFRSSLARAERVGAGPLLRSWVSLLLFASRWFQIASLYRANAKLRPTWEPRFLCFVDVRDLGPITVAVLRAEGFWHPPWPRGPGRPLAAEVPRPAVPAHPAWRSY